MSDQISTPLKTTWQQILDLLAEIDETKSSRAQGILANLHPISLENHILLLGTELVIAKQWTEKHYKKFITDSLQIIFGEPYDVSVIIENEQDSQQAQTQTTNKASQQDTSTFSTIFPSKNKEDTTPPLITNKTFENFVVGESNRTAYDTALGVAGAPGAGLNPFFIYGRSGLGKTHLLFAIYNYIRRYLPHLKVCYEATIDFVNEYIEAGASHSYDRFRRKYFSYDVFLLDDVQQLEGKVETTNMLFELFNNFIMHNKAIVLSADRSPSEIDIDERYTSRFAMGITADIQKPTFEMKVAIFNNFKDYYCNTLRINNFKLDNEIIEYIIGLSGPNMRELDSAAMNLVYFYKSRRGDQNYQKFDLKTVASVIKGSFSHTSKEISIKEIQKAVEKHFNVTHNELLSKSKKHDISSARQIAMYLSTVLTSASTPDIGNAFGGFHHTAVMYAKKNIIKNYMSNPQKKAEIENLVRLLRNS
ncbi:MAG: chromosomal replication initiator protein DnaA [Coriobacteriales bacterium]|jgi:chromosomal replication initiator protein|nr:chromosomal replication initiator protein DnaA [Coriobacteriales bacterium]